MVVVVVVVPLVVMVGVVVVSTVASIRDAMRVVHNAGCTHSRSKDGGEDKGG